MKNKPAKPLTSHLSPLTKSTRGRPRHKNPSADALRMRQYHAAIKSGARKVKQVPDYISLKFKRNKSRATYGVYADRIFSRPIMRVGVCLPST